MPHPGAAKPAPAVTGNRLQIDRPGGAIKRTTHNGAALSAQAVALDLVGEDGDHRGVVDPISVFAERAQARAYQWAHRMMRFREAFGPLLAEGARDGIVEPEQPCRSCGSLPCINPAFCERCLVADREVMPARRPAPRREAARSTFDAVLYALRTHGVAVLAEPTCQNRLREFSRAQRDELIAALARLKCGDDLILGLKERR